MVPRSARHLAAALFAALLALGLGGASCSPFGSDDPTTSSSGGADASSETSTTPTDGGLDAGGDAVAPDAARGKLVFVIKDALAGNFNVGDDDAADKACTAEGAAVAPGAKFMAGLCGRQAGPPDLATRLPSATEWVTKGGVVAARTGTGTLTFVAPVTNLADATTEAVWTGCMADGKAKPMGGSTTSSCTQWNSVAGVNDRGGLGDPSKPAAALDSGDAPCSAPHRWYCFEVPQ